MKIVIFFIVATLFIACNNQEEIPAGGPCSYRSEIHPAKLISIKQIDSINIDAQFEISWQTSKDTISYYMAKHHYLTADQIKTDSLNIGNVYQYVEEFMVSGNCNPHIKYLELIKMK
jgi:hypothetical protein